MAPAQLGKQEALQQFSVDLPERARNGEIDPIVGRDEEIRQLVDILMRRRQNNPILTGEAGVGNTSVVEGFAQWHRRRRRAPTAPGRHPAHPGYRSVAGQGQHEGRVRESTAPGHRRGPILTDAHHPICRRSQYPDRRGRCRQSAQTGLGPGTLRTIAATTWGEYKKHIEKDPDLPRRF